MPSRTRNGGTTYVLTLFGKEMNFEDDKSSIQFGSCFIAFRLEEIPRRFCIFADCIARLGGPFGLHVMGNA